MSYRTWITYGYGICVDDINTTPERLLQLAKLDRSVYKIVNDYINEFDDGIAEDGPSTIDDFRELEGDYGEHDVAYVLYNVISEIEIVYANDYEGVQYLLYLPTYPWYLKEKEEMLREEDVKNIFKKYVSILTDEPIKIDYYEVENGG